MKKIFTVLVLSVLLGISPSRAQETIRYEYKILPLGSLTALQKKSGSQARLNEVENTLNEEGLQGWEMVNIFAVRTTFDPNVFFVAMKRPVPGPRTQEKE